MHRLTRHAGAIGAALVLYTLIATSQAAPAMAAPTFKLPFECGQAYVGSTYANPPHTPAVDFNQGSNLDAGDEVLASAGGQVTYAGGYDGKVHIDHGGGWWTVYAHMSGIQVTQGESVVTGELLGFVDDVGNAVGEHLHYEQVLGSTKQSVRFNGAAYAYNTSITSNLCLSPPFTDHFDSPFVNDINWLHAAGVSSGCDTIRYCPSANVDRGQMAAFLDRFLHLPPTSSDFFTDDEGSPFEDNINRVRAAGITNGCSATQFCPSNLVTREQMAAFLDRALGLPATSTDFFTDDEASPFEANINRVAAAGITTGCAANAYCPANLVTREQMAAYLHRADPYRN